MPALITDIMRSSAAVWELDNRLAYHTQPGKMLAGMKYDREGTLKADGKDDLPLIQPWSINFDEALFPGAPSPGANSIARKNHNAAETLILVYRLGFRRDHAFCRRDPTNVSAPKGMVEWLCLIRDAMETSAASDPIIDSGLAGSLMRPLGFAIRESETTQMAYYTFLEVTLPLHVACRAGRSQPLPVV
jgi:hypothetical protein